MNSRAVVTRAFTVCPACRNEINATFTLDLELGSLDNVEDSPTVNLTGKIIGAHIEHNCTPSVKR